MVSGKLDNVEVKEMVCSARLATPGLSNTNKARCLFKGESRSVRLKSGLAVASGSLPSAPFPICSPVGC